MIKLKNTFLGAPARNCFDIERTVFCRTGVSWKARTTKVALANNMRRRGEEKKPD